MKQKMTDDENRIMDLMKELASLKAEMDRLKDIFKSVEVVTKTALKEGFMSLPALLKIDKMIEQALESEE